jgi:hypothetical protein
VTLTINQSINSAEEEEEDKGRTFELSDQITNSIAFSLLDKTNTHTVLQTNTENHCEEMRECNETKYKKK